MAVIENKSTEIGDVLVIKTDVPVIGVVTLLSFVDDTEGEVGDKYFTKTFRYSIDGINWSAYIPLTNANIQGIEIDPTDSLVIEYVYQRSGLDESGSLAFNSITLNGEFTDVPCGDAYESSMFSHYFSCNNACTLNWSINVLEKIYKKGILPNFVVRGETSSNSQDRDFIDFWRSVTHYFGLYVCLARTFGEFYADENLLKNYLEQRNLFFCDDTISYQDLYYLMQNYHDEIRQRGTIQIIKEKDSFEFVSDCDDSVSVSDSVVDGEKQIDGELLRLICYDALDEFLFNLCKNEKIGWNINNSSPLYSGMSNQNGVNKAYEDTQDIEDLSTYPLLNANNCSLLTNEGKQVMHIGGVANGAIAGIGDLDFTKAIKVDPGIDYEITFVVKQDSDESISQSVSVSESLSDSVSNVGNLTFGCFAFDSYGSLVSLETIAPGHADEDFFFEKIALPRSDKYYHLRGMVFNSSKYSDFATNTLYTKGKIVYLSGVYYKCIRDTIYGITPGVSFNSSDYWEVVSAEELRGVLQNSLNIGNNLRFKSSVNYILPYIVLDNENNAGGELFIWDVKIKPVSTPYSHGFIQTPNFIHIWMNNRNGRYSDEEIRKIMRKFLLPYDCTFKNINLGTDIEAELLKITQIGSFNEDFNLDYNIGTYSEV